MSDDKNDLYLIAYYVDRTDERLKSIETKLELLIGFKYMILGGSFVVSAIVSFIIAIFTGAH